MMYRVARDFVDALDGHLYHAGEQFPRAGATVTAARLAELSGNGNRLATPLIIPEAEPPDPEPAQDERPRRGRRKAGGIV